MIRLPSATATLLLLALAISCAGETPPATQANAPLPEATLTGNIKTWTQIIFYLTPLIVSIPTAAAAIWRFQLYRMGKAAIRIDMEVASRRSSPSYNALSAVATLTNTGRVVAKCSRLVWRIRVLAPYRDGDVETMTEAYQEHHSVETVPVEFPWNVNYTLSRNDSQISLEPGEANTVSMSLAIPYWIEAVDVEFVLQEAGHSEETIETGWVARRSHNIVQEMWQ